MLAKQFCRAFANELAQGDARQRPAGNAALIITPIADLATFGTRLSGRHGFIEQGRQLIATPNVVAQERLKAEWIEWWNWHGALAFRREIDRSRGDTVSPASPSAVQGAATII